MSQPQRPPHSPAATAKAQSFHAALVQTVAEAVAREPVVVVGMAQNPFVKKARKALEGAGIAFTYLEYGSYLSQWRERLAWGERLTRGGLRLFSACLHGTDEQRLFGYRIADWDRLRKRLL